jgi:TP901 family phage tail tape measure protein
VTDRTVRVRYDADASGFVAGVTKMQSVQDGFTKSAQSSAQSHTAAMNQIGQGLVVAGGIVGAFAACATGDSLSGLRDLAIDMGAKTQFSATEAAQGITEMAKAGVSTADIMGGGLKGALDLAAAGQLGVGRAGEIAATAMNQFGLSGNQVSHVADLLAAGAGKAQGSVEDLALGLTYVGPVAAGMGISIEQTTGVLAEFAAAGLVGEKGGTALRGVLLSLTAPSDAASKTMSELGIHLYDAQGKFVGVDGAAQQLHDRLSPLDEATRNAALGQIFGNAQLAGAQVLYQGGAKAVQEWTGKVNDSGFAARQAAALTDNLKGDLERLGGAFDTVLIQSGSAANGGLRGLVQTAEHGIEAFGNLSPVIQTTVLAVSGIGGGALIAVGGFVLLAVKVAETAKAFKELELASGRSGAALGVLGKAAGVVTLAAASVEISRMGAAALVADPATANLARNLDQMATGTNEGLTSLGSLFSSFGKNVTSSAEILTEFGANAKAALNPEWYETFSGTATQAAGAFEERVSKIDAALVQMVNSGHAQQAAAIVDQLSKSTVQFGGNADAVRQSFTGYNAALAGNTSALTGTSAASDTAATAAQKVAEGAKSAAQAQAEQAKAAADAAKANEDLIKSLTTLSNLTLGARGAQREFQAAIDAASDAVKKNGKTLDDNTDKGRANNAALDKLGDAVLKNVEATFRARDANQSLGDAVKVAEGQVSAGREAFVKAATGMGLNRDAAARLADQLGLTTANVDRLSKTVEAVPNEKTTQVTAKTEVAEAKVNSITKHLDAIPDPTRSVTVMNAVALARADATTRRLDAIPDHTSTVTGNIAPVLGAVGTASGAINAIPNHTSSIFANLPVLGSVAVASSAILGVPNKTAQVDADPSGARAGAASAQAAINSVTGKTVTITTNHVDNYSGNYANKPTPAATGGPVIGPGTGTSDTAGLWALSNGEHVLTAAEVNAAGGHGEIMRLRKALLAGAVQYAATGGPVGPSANDLRYRNAAGTTSPAAPQTVVHLTVNPSPGMDEYALAAAVAHRLGV